jgi:hypothetical protein
MTYQGLEKRSITIPFAGGVDEGKDEYVLESPNASQAEGARFGAEGQVGRRYGASALSSSGMPSSGDGAHNSLLDHAGKLAIWGPQGCHAWNELESEWTETNEHAPRPSRMLTDPLIRGNNSIKRSDIAVSGNLACVVWEDETDSAIRYAFFDTTPNGTAKPRLVAGPVELATVTQAPRVITINSGATFVIVAGNGTSGLGATLYHAVYHVSAGDYTFSAPASLGFGTGGSFFSWDIATDGGQYYTVAAVATTTTIFRLCTQAGYAFLSHTVADFQVLSVMVNTALSRVVAFGRDPSNPEDGATVYFSADYNVPPGAVNYGVGGLIEPLQRGTLCQRDSSGAMFACYSDGQLSSVVAAPVVGNPDANSGGGMSYIDTDGLLECSGWVRGLELVGKAAYLLPSTGIEGVVVPLARRAELPDIDPNYAASFNARAVSPIGYLCRPILDSATNTLQVAEWGRFLVDRVWENDETYHLSHTASLSDDDLVLTATVLTDIGSREGAVVSLSSSGGSVIKTQIDLVRARVFGAAPAEWATAQGLRLGASGSGCVSFDGATMNECTLPTPTTVRLGDDLATGQVLETTFVGYLSYYKLCYRWVDAAGRVHRSAPSGEFYQSSEALKGNEFSQLAPAVIFFPPYPSAPNGDREAQYEVELYQSADGELYYLTAILKPLEYPSNPNFDYIQIIRADSGTLSGHQAYLNALSAAPEDLGAQLALYPPAYFNEELHNAPSPPLLDICSTQTRVWLLSAEARDEVWPSKPLDPLRAPEFSAELVTRIPQEGGECVAIAALDDKVIVFKERLVFALFGEPADAEGDNSTLQNARLISGDVGCTSASSVVEGPFGVAFLSERGIYTLSRSLEFAFVGSTVKDTTEDATVVSGVLVPSQSEVRWGLSDGTVIVWNYRLNQWSTWPGLTHTHATLWRGAYTRFSGSSVRKETVGDWSVGGASMTYATPWIKLGGLQGFKRVWRATLLGRRFDGGVIVFVGYNYNDEYAEFRVWTPEEMDLLVSEDTGYRMQLAVRPSRQKCESVRFAFVSTTSEGGDGETAGRGAEFVGLQLDVGLKKGAYKSLAAAAKK